MTYQVRLDAFEGPLDLLYYLIKKNNIDIYDIPMAEITSQYLEYIEIMEKLNLEVAGEFLVMSATLIHIKSELLLPKPEISEEEDPRDELVKKLLEYEKIKKASLALKERELEQRGIFTRGRITFSEEDYILDANLFDLLDAFKKLISNIGKEEIKEILQEEVSVEDRINEIMGLIKDKGCIVFSDIANEKMGKKMIIATLIALLELIKQRKIYARQAKPYGDIKIFKSSDEEDKNRPSPEEGQQTFDDLNKENPDGQ